ncbi:MAG TPA: hypothetical protein VFZ66_29860 [Herpetosiphonaceae bacterium]
MIGATSSKRIRLPYPHPGQRHVRTHRRRFTWLAAGRRWRKTTLFVSLMVEAAASGTPIVWGAPTYDQVFTAWEELRRAGREVISFNQSRMTATLGRGQMLFRSLDDPENARSKTAGGIVLDEVADIAEVAWVEVLRPMLMDTNGWLLAGGTPKGRNWFWRECMAAQRGDDPETVFFQAPSLGATITAQGLVRAPHPLENPDLPWKEIEHLYRTMPERSFRQEILAEFIEDAGGVFRGVRRQATAIPQTQAIEGHAYIIGVDWGRTNDATVFSVIDATLMQQVAVDRMTATDYALQRARLWAMWERFGRCTVVAEMNSMGGPLVEQLSRDGLRVRGFQTTSATKSVIIDALALAFERETLQILPDESQIAELEAYESERLPSGLIRYSAPGGMHDDYVMALALAYSGVGRTSSAIGAFG